MRKQWVLHLNDAVSIFQSWQGGLSAGIIVKGPTGCPEEELRAELYASIQGQWGARQGGSHHTSSLFGVLECLPGKWGCLFKPGCRDFSVLLHKLGLNSLCFYNWHGWRLLTMRKWKHKISKVFSKRDLFRDFWSRLLDNWGGKGKR